MLINIFFSCKFSELFGPEWKEKMVLYTFGSILESETFFELFSPEWEGKMEMVLGFHLGMEVSSQNSRLMHLLKESLFRNLILQALQSGMERENGFPNSWSGLVRENSSLNSSVQNGKGKHFPNSSVWTGKRKQFSELFNLEWKGKMVSSPSFLIQNARENSSPSSSVWNAKENVQNVKENGSLSSSVLRTLQFDGEIGRISFSSSLGFQINSPLVWALEIRKQFMNFILDYGSFFMKFPSDLENLVSFEVIKTFFSERLLLDLKNQNVGFVTFGSRNSELELFSSKIWNWNYKFYSASEIWNRKRNFASEINILTEHFFFFCKFTPGLEKLKHSALEIETETFAPKLEKLRLSFSLINTGALPDLQLIISPDCRKKEWVKELVRSTLIYRHIIDKTSTDPSCDLDEDIFIQNSTLDQSCTFLLSFFNLTKLINIKKTLQKSSSTASYFSSNFYYYHQDLYYKVTELELDPIDVPTSICLLTSLNNTADNQIHIYTDRSLFYSQKGAHMTILATPLNISLTIYTDSQAAIDDIQFFIDLEEKYISFQLVKIKGHADDSHNETADLLAKQESYS
ncbi:hypothetical protein C1645_817564 [Glomus cerebriforme]|uniref:Uncharacterized protein n=1 Tax=Glomus cerebriforme TaxID=658196 RepID=A0A397T955_9GLOM|nr:hypothetical protein C1645_817564 [Glomus cerebriforme]